MRDRETEIPRPGESELQSPQGSEKPRPRGSARHRNRASHATHDTKEIPPLKAPVRSLQEAAQLALADPSGNDSCFKFARAFKAFKQTVGTPLAQAELTSAFNVFWAQAKQSALRGLDYDECRLAFLDAIKKARTPLGANVMENARQQMDSTPPPPPAARYPNSPRIQKLVHLCFVLQSFCGDAPFFLSARDAASVIGSDPQTAAMLLRGLVEDGVLDLVKIGTITQRQASRFRFRDPDELNLPGL